MGANQWLPATIVNVNATQFKVHLSGEGNEYDQWVSKDLLRSTKVGKKENTAPVPIYTMVQPIPTLQKQL